MIGTCLDHISNCLGWDHAWVFGSVFAIVTSIGHLRYRGRKLTDSKEWDRLLNRM